MRSTSPYGIVGIVLRYDRMNLFFFFGGEPPPTSRLVGYRNEMIIASQEEEYDQ